ncbi:EAL domain-containing protein [Luteitalea sp.]|uniref:putative bifunctional diguanylate cyclase/phosphodiesterase n=1 Tax=Luteitalea sp. TaxID=2004800 RepID=UPI0025C50812|nr:EAL domain-containing protein [Luteitalea sp.]
MTDTPVPLLVVDDDPINRDMLSRRLVRSGFAVETAASGREALAFVDTRPTELVLLDVQMPGMSGLDVLQAIRRTRLSSVLPVLMVTAKDQSEDIVAALELGADDYITKPIDFPVALARIRTQLARKRAEERLRESEERYALAARGANDGLWDWNLTSGEMYFSPRWKTIVGCEEHEVGSQPREWFDRVHPDDQSRVQDELGAHLAGRTSHLETEHRIRHQSGAFRWVLTRGIAVRDANGVAVRMAGSQADLTDGKVVDPLTSLPNGLLLNDRLDRALHSRLEDGHGCAVLFLDLDEFKTINDSLGERCGDDLLRAVAGRLAAALRSTDSIAHAETEWTSPPASIEHTLARLGGDEFIILLDDVRSAIDASRVAERIQRSLVSPFVVSGRDIFTSASIGIALSQADQTRPQDLLRDAHTAMVRAKSGGKGQSEMFDPTMRAQVLHRLEQDTELRLALARGEFLPYFQPIVDLGTGRLCGFEALLRWCHPRRGIVSPAEFVPVIEDNGLVVPIGQQFFDRVCRHLREWQQTDTRAEPLTINVNFASRQFVDEELAMQLVRSLERTHLSPTQIVIEITERTALQDEERTHRVLEQLRDAGFRIVLDDFGTGYSSLSCLYQLPISGFKLDCALVQAGQRHPALLKTVVKLAESLELSVTAEGIETEAQCQHLRALGCNMGQGYLFARPVDATQAAEMIARDEVWLPVAVMGPECC